MASTPLRRLTFAGVAIGIFAVGYWYFHRNRTVGTESAAISQKESSAEAAQNRATAKPPGHAALSPASTDAAATTSTSLPAAQEPVPAPSNPKLVETAPQSAAEASPDKIAKDATAVTAVAPQSDTVLGTVRMITAHAPLRQREVADPDSSQNREILQVMIGKAIARQTETSQHAN